MSPGLSMAFLVTCEHGGARVPAAHRRLFVGAEALLASHRGWDAGSASLAQELARALDAQLHVATLTRLLVDLNRSATNPKVFSELTRRLPRPERAQLLEAYHTPHREEVEASVARLAHQGRPVVHLAVHSFTPSLQGRVRSADIALLYDPARASERSLCGGWVSALSRRFPDLAVRRNQPYRGASDGLTTWLRTRYPDTAYLGVEIEVNQRLLDSRNRFPPRIFQGLLAGVLQAVA